LDLLRASIPMVIVADALCSRHVANLTVGLEQARQAGALITSTESVVFQWLWARPIPTPSGS
jgi:hypothetical protein